MKIRIYSHHFDPGDELRDYIHKKLGKLDKFSDRLMDAEVLLKVDHDRKGEDKVIEIKLNVPGDQLFVKTQGRRFEPTLLEAIDTLVRQLHRYKQK